MALKLAAATVATAAVAICGAAARIVTRIAAFGPASTAFGHRHALFQLDDSRREGIAGVAAGPETVATAAVGLFPALAANADRGTGRDREHLCVRGRFCIARRRIGWNDGRDSRQD